MVCSFKKLKAETGKLTLQCTSAIPEFRGLRQDSEIKINIKKTLSFEKGNHKLMQAV